jgi:hypothetical protein
MIVIVANRWDQTPRSVASHWAPHTVAVLTAQDLSVAGWHQRLSASDGGTAVAELKRVPQKEITGVLTLLPCIFEEELVDVAPEDRGYVAAEMTAFLLVWLSRLRCPVLNRPTPTCLSGPYWRREKWVSVAAQAGIPAEPVRRHAAASGCAAEGETLPVATTVTVVGNRAFGAGEPGLQRQALRLARLAGVELLAVHFSSAERGAHFVGADAFPNLSDDGVADAVLEYLRRGPTRCA